MISSPAILHAAWITAAVAVCLALCTSHSRKNSSSSSSSAPRGSSRSASARGSTRPCREDGGGGAATVATPAATKVSPTPRDTAKADYIGELQTAAAACAWDDVVMQDGAAGPVTVIDVGTHGPIAPVFPVPDPQLPRRSLSVKHIRFAERLGRIRSRRWGGDDDDEASGGAPGDSTLWTKTILLGERCRVPNGDDNDGDDAMVRWKSYRPRKPRSTPVTRSNSFAGVDNRAGSAGSWRPAGARV